MPVNFIQPSFAAGRRPMRECERKKYSRLRGVAAECIVHLFLEAASWL